jgi:hypothetical protein
VENAEQDLAGAEERHEQARAAWQAAADQLGAAERSVEELRRRQREAEPDPELLQRRTASQVALARAEGKLEELQRRQAFEPVIDPAPAEAVLTAAQREAQGRMDDTDLMARLNEEILTLAHRFGLHPVDKVGINRAARLPVTKGDIEEPFSALSPSEKLRLRVATVIALLRVAEQGGPARHPGLIVIDSPASEEVADANLDEMLRELETLAGQVSHLQVLLATTRTEAVTAALPSDNLRLVRHAEYLW